MFALVKGPGAARSLSAGRPFFAILKSSVLEGKLHLCKGILFGEDEVFVKDNGLPTVKSLKS